MGIKVVSSPDPTLKEEKGLVNLDTILGPGNSSGSRQVSIVSVETPFGRLEIQAHLWSGSVDFQEIEPPALATDLRKLLLWLTLACISRREDSSCRKQIDWAGSFAQNDRNGRGSLKMGVASKIFARASRATV